MQLASIGFNVLRLASMDFNGLQLSSMDCNGLQWTSMDFSLVNTFRLSVGKETPPKVRQWAQCSRHVG